MTHSSDRQFRHAKAFQIALAGYWFALLVGTHLPPDVAAMPGRFDKLVHAVAYLLLAALLATTWQWSAGRLTTRHLCWAWVALAVYAALDEWTQIPVGRDASLLDWLADVTGALVGLALFRWWSQKRHAESPPEVQ